MEDFLNLFFCDGAESDAIGSNLRVDFPDYVQRLNANEFTFPVIVGGYCDVIGSFSQFLEGGNYLFLGGLCHHLSMDQIPEVHLLPVIIPGRIIHSHHVTA